MESIGENKDSSRRITCTACQGIGWIKNHYLICNALYSPVPCPWCSDSFTPDLDITYKIKYYAKLTIDNKLVEQQYYK